MTKEQLEKDIQEAIARIDGAQKQVRISSDVIQRNYGIIEYCQKQIEELAVPKEEKKEDVISPVIV